MVLAQYRSGPGVASHAIVLVDDEEDTRILLCEVLKRRGYEIESVNSGEACLDRLANDPAAIVVTDVEMPGMSGIELCDILRTRHPEVIPIVISARVDNATEAEALAVGAFTFLRKPITSSAIDIVLRDALDTIDRRQPV